MVIRSLPFLELHTPYRIVASPFGSKLYLNGYDTQKSKLDFSLKSRCMLSKHLNFIMDKWKPLFSYPDPNLFLPVPLSLNKLPSMQLLRPKIESNSYLIFNKFCGSYL